MKKSILFKQSKFLKGSLSYFLFALAFTSCSTKANQIAPKSIENFKVDFFLEKGINVDESKKRIFYQYIFKDDNSYTMKSNTPFQRSLEPEKRGTYEYSVKSADKALLWVHFIDNTGEKNTYEVDLNFEDSKSGTWSSQGLKLFHETASGIFIIEKQVH